MNEVNFARMRGKLFPVLFFLSLFSPSFPLNNGLALTPPMGWMSWLRFGCNYECDLDPDNCIKLVDLFSLHFGSICHFITSSEINFRYISVLNEQLFGDLLLLKEVLLIGNFNII